MRIKQHYDLSYRDTVLHACLHNLAYDRQLEGDRADYMLEVINATGDFAYYRAAILDALKQLSDEDEDYDVQQIFSLSGYFAERGDAEAREILTNKFLEYPALADFGAAEALIALDGLAGFIFVSEVLSEHLRAKGSLFQVGEQEYELESWRLPISLEEKIGEAEAEQQIKQLRHTHPQLIPALDIFEQNYQPHERQRSPLKPSQSYDEIKRLIHETPSGDLRHHICVMWGKQASDADLLRAAQDLLAETDPDRQQRYLAIFRGRAFPLNPIPLFPLAQRVPSTPSANWRVFYAAIRALENVDHPDVRAFALEKINAGDPAGEYIRLLKGAYFQPEDWSLIATLTSRPHDEEDAHAMGFCVTDLFDQLPLPQAAPALLNLYEHDPCANCRAHLVYRLHKLNAIPDWMREECLYDSNFDLREEMRDNFKKWDQEPRSKPTA